MISFFIILLITIPISWFVGWQTRTWLGIPSELEKSLTADLEEAKNQLKKYQVDVNHHFEKTAHLFNQILMQSKNLHDYLLSSSKELCFPESMISSMKIANSDPESWHELVVKNNAHKIDPANAEFMDHNWHPTYFEARDAKYDFGDFKEKLNLNLKPLSNNKTDNSDPTDNTDSIVDNMAFDSPIDNFELKDLTKEKSLPLSLSKTTELEHLEEKV